MAVRLKIKFDAADVLAALSAMPHKMSKNLRVAQKSALVDVQRLARSKHRYTTRSGELEKATGGTGPEVSESGLIATLELKQNIPYSRRIHEGGGGKRDSLGRRMTNRPDRFLYKAFNSKRKDIEEKIESAIEKTIKDAGF